MAFEGFASLKLLTLLRKIKTNRERGFHMKIDEIKIPQDPDERESFLASYAVELDHQKARALGFPRYYVKDGFLVEERNGQLRKIKPITRNLINETQ